MRVYIAIILLFSFNVSAEIVSCDTKMSSFIIEADRKSDEKYSNLFLIKFTDQNDVPFKCNGATFGYIENTSGAHDSIVSLSFFLTAQNQMATMKIESNDRIGAAARIEYILPVNN